MNKIGDTEKWLAIGARNRVEYHLLNAGAELSNNNSVSPAHRN